MWLYSPTHQMEPAAEHDTEKSSVMVEREQELLPFPSISWILPASVLTPPVCPVSTLFSSFLYHCVYYRVKYFSKWEYTRHFRKIYGHDNIDIFTNVGKQCIVIIKMNQGIKNSFNYETIITPFWYSYTKLHFLKKSYSISILWPASATISFYHHYLKWARTKRVNKTAGILY